MSQRELSVKSREITGKEAAKKLRRAGYVPAIAYGHHEEPTKLSVHAKQFRDLVSQGGSHGLIKLQFEENSQPELNVIIKAVQKHPVSREVITIDFLHVALDERVKATVPVVLEGEPVGVKVDGGVLVQILHEIEVEALPQALPSSVTVDVSELVFDGAPYFVKDIVLPEGVSAVTPGDDGVAVVTPPTVIAPTAEEEAAEADAAPAA